MIGRIREFCGGAGADAPSGAAAPAGMAEAESEELDREFFGVHFEGLGDVWAAVFGEDEENEVVRCLQWVASEGVLLPGCDVVYEAEGRRVALLQAPAEGDLRVAALVAGEDGQAGMGLVSSYPLLDGPANDLVVAGVHAWSNGLEGVVAARLAPDGPPLTFFAPFHFRDFQRFRPGARLSVSLGAMALSLRKARLSELEVSEGPLHELGLAERRAGNPDGDPTDLPASTKVSLAGSSILLPSRYVCEWEYRCPVLDVAETELRGIPFLRITTEFLRGDGAALRGCLYASERVLEGCVPQRGDDVEGGLWMSGITGVS